MATPWIKPQARGGPQKRPRTPTTATTPTATAPETSAASTPSTPATSWRRSKKKPGTTVSYEVNGTGAVEKKTDSAEPANKRTTTYNYRGTRLTSSEDADTRSEYRYDDFGNAVRIETKTKGAVELPPVNELPATPQTCGELDTEGGITRYCYDEFERMVAAKGPGLGSDAEQAVYTYDGFDRRDTKRIKKGSSDVTRDYGYVGTSKLLSREQNRAGETKYYDYSAEGEREGQATANAGSSEPSRYRTYSKDANGSVTELEDEQGSDKGADGKANEYLYDPYGELDRAGEPEGAEGEEAKLGSEAKDNPFRYEGFYYDSGVKTYDMGARQYRPESGRFLSQDRYESARGDLELQADPLTQNRYAFAGGNPVSNVEFDGHLFELSFGKGFFNQLARGLGVRRPTRRTARPAPSRGVTQRAVRLFDTAPQFVSLRGLRTPLLRRLAPPRPPKRRCSGVDPCQAEDAAAALEKEFKGTIEAAKDPLGSAEGILNAVTHPGRTISVLSKSCDGLSVGGCAGTVFGTALGGKGVKQLAKLPPGGAKKRIPCASSFVPGTFVLMADGAYRRIERVRVGERVMAGDPNSGHTRTRRVTRLITSAGTKRLVALTIDGRRTLATANHPFYLVDEGRFAHASKLRAGMRLRRADGSIAVVERARAFSVLSQRVHNLSVEGEHSYYAGASPVLVHNSPCDDAAKAGDEAADVGTDLALRPKLKPSRHYLHERKMERQLRTADVFDAYKNPLAVGPTRYDPFGRPSTLFQGRNAQVAVNPQTGEIVTAFPTGSQLRRQLLRGAGGGP